MSMRKTKRGVWGSIFGSAMVLVASMRSAHATVVNPQALEQQQTDVAVPLSQTDIETQLSAREKQDEANRNKTSTIELSASSWEPKNLSLNSIIPNPSAFSAGAPDLNLTWINHFKGDMYLQIGFGFLQMSRSGTESIADQTLEDTQAAYLTQAHAGLEYELRKYSSKTFTPYGAFSLLPTFVFTSRSELDQGSSQFGVPVELQAGTLVHLIKAADFDVGISETLGTASSSNLGGFGVSAGVRVTL